MAQHHIGEPLARLSHDVLASLRLSTPISTTLPTILGRSYTAASGTEGDGDGVSNPSSNSNSHVPASRPNPSPNEHPRQTPGQRPSGSYGRGRGSTVLKPRDPSNPSRVSPESLNVRPGQQTHELRGKPQFHRTNRVPASNSSPRPSPSSSPVSGTPPTANQTYKPNLSPSVVSHMFSAYVRSGKILEAERTLATLLSSGALPELSSLPAAVNILVKTGQLESMEKLLGDVKAAGGGVSEEVWSLAVEAYAKAGNIDKMEAAAANAAAAASGMSAAGAESAAAGASGMPQHLLKLAAERGREAC